MILLALYLLANVAALVAIALWYRRDRSDLIADRDAANAETKRLRTMLASAEADAEHDAEIDRRSRAKLARIARQNDEHTLAVAEQFRAHLDSHACLPFLEGIENAEPSDGPAPIYDELAGVVVPMKKRAQR